MFCSKCGKQIADGSNFCPYCGGKQEIVSQSSNNSMDNTAWTNSLDKNPTGIAAGFSAVDILLAVFYVILFIKWSASFIPNFSNTLKAFEFLGDGYRIGGISIYCVPYICMIALLAEGVREIIKHQYHIGIGVLTAGLGIIMKIGAFIFNEISFEPMKLIFYRIFLVYDNSTVIAIVLGAVITVLLLSKANLHSK